MEKAGVNKGMENNRITKYGLLHRYMNNAFFRFLVRKVFFPCHFMSFFKVIEARTVLEYLNPINNETIGDIACGCGEQSIQIAKKGGCVYGIDMDKKAIEIARVLCPSKCKFMVANAEKLPFESNFFDKVVSVCALEHFENDDQAIQEMSRVMKSGGILVLTVDSFTYRGINKILQAKHKIRAHVVNYYSLPQLSKKLEKYGFHVEKAKYLINSPLSSFFLGLWMRNRWLGLAAFPISYGLSVLSDRFSDERNEGYFLAIRARKANGRQIDAPSFQRAFDHNLHVMRGLKGTIKHTVET